MTVRRPTMTRMSGSPPVRPLEVRDDGRAGPMARRLPPGPPGVSLTSLRRVAWRSLLVAPALASCIFPEFDIVPEVNLPLSFDLSVFDPPSPLAAPDVPHVLETCVDGRLQLTLDPREALVNPDEDVTFWFWIVDDRGRPTGFPDAKGFENQSPFVSPFVFDACLNPNVKTDAINTVKLVVRDRPPTGEATNEAVKKIDDGDDPTTSIATLVWQIQVVNIDCCRLGNE